jgi:ActR/RegA family two-component response regulator
VLAEVKDDTLLLVPTVRHVLVVDDDQEFAQNLALVLRTRGYVVSVAFDVEGALIRVAERTPEVAILDIRLGPSSGIDLIPILRARAPGIVCIMATAYAEADTAIQALRFGADDYLKKPFDPDQMLAVLERSYAKLMNREDHAGTVAQERAALRAAQATNEKMMALVKEEMRDPLAEVGSTLLAVDREIGNRMSPTTLTLMRGAYRKVEKLVQRLASVVTPGGEVARADRDRVSEVIEDATHDAGAAIARAGSRMSVDCPADVAALPVEGRTARRVLATVLESAARLTPHGRISVFVAAGGGGATGRKVTFRVKDTGAGIDANVIANTLAVSGAGDRGGALAPEASLSEAGAVCRAHGGSFVVQSSVGEGTTVSFALPVRGAELGS